MAASVRRACALCDSREPAKYTCPRCNVAFCSSTCYASSAHTNCSEDFYRDCVHAHLKSNGDSGENKRRIVQILEKLKREEESQNDDSDDDPAPDISERFAEIDLEDENLGVDAIWSRLTEKEKSEFKSLVDSGAAEKLLSVWKPWWAIKETVKLIQEVESENALPENLGSSPQVPATIPKLETLTKGPPSVKLKYNIINALYVYVFVARFYNGDHHEFPIESVQAIMEFSECLSRNVTFNDAEQAILSAMKQIQQNREMPAQQSLALTAVTDVKHLVEGPRPQPENIYVLSALSDLKSLIGKCRKLLRKVEQREFKIKLKLVEKKLGYYLSWTNDYYRELVNIVIELDLVQASVAADWACFDEDNRRVESRRSKPPAKPKIEELT